LWPLRFRLRTTRIDSADQVAAAHFPNPSDTHTPDTKLAGNCQALSAQLRRIVFEKLVGGSQKQ
jgi:hypothetical protein